VAIRDLWRAYERLGEAEDAQIDAASFVDYAHSENAWLESEAGRRLSETMQAELGGGPPPLALPYRVPRESVTSARMRAEAFTLTEEQVSALVASARSLKTTPFVVMLGAFKVLLARYSAVRETLVVTVTAGRQRGAEPDMVGPLMSRLAIRAVADPDLPFVDHVRRVSGGVARGLARSRASITDWLGQVTLPNRPVEAWFNYIPGEGTSFPAALASTPVTVDQRSDYVPDNWLGMTLFCEAVVASDGAPIHFSTHEDLLDDETAQALLADYERLLLAALADPGQSLTELWELCEAPAEGPANGAGPS
jgi:non-ribosomal peptide synthetase component F